MLPVSRLVKNINEEYEAVSLLLFQKYNKIMAIRKSCTPETEVQANLCIEQEAVGINALIKTVNTIHVDKKHDEPFLHFLVKKNIYSVGYFDTLYRLGMNFGVRTTRQGLSVLAFASENGDLDFIKFLVEEVRLKLGMFEPIHPIAIAIVFKHKDITEYLIDNFSTYSNDTLLNMACRSGYIHLVQRFIKNPGNFEPDPRGMTPLMNAALYGKPNVKQIIIRMLLSINPNYLEKNARNHTVFHLIFQCKEEELVNSFFDHPDFLKYIYENSGEECNDGYLPIHYAIIHNKIDWVHRILKNNPSVAHHIDSLGRSLITIAVMAGNLALIRDLHEKYGLSLTIANNKGHTLLEYCAGGDRVDIAQYLKEKNAADLNPVRSLPSPLLVAIQENKPGMIEWILSQETFDLTYVFNQSKKSHGEFKLMIEFCLDHKLIQINDVFGEHAEPLFHLWDRLFHSVDPTDTELYNQLNGMEKAALRLGYYQANVQSILKYKPDMNRRDGNDLHFLAKLIKSSAENCSRIQWLCDYLPGMKLTDLDSRGSSLLHLAVEEQHLELVRWCVKEKKMSILKNRRDGFNALDCAIQINNLDICSFLIGELSDKQWKQYLEALVKKGREEVVSQVKSNDFYNRKPLAWAKEPQPRVCDAQSEAPGNREHVAELPSPPSEIEIQRAVGDPANMSRERDDVVAIVAPVPVSDTSAYIPVAQDFFDAIAYGDELTFVQLCTYAGNLDVEFILQLASFAVERGQAGVFERLLQMAWPVITTTDGFCNKLICAAMEAGHVLLANRLFYLPAIQQNPFLYENRILRTAYCNGCFDIFNAVVAWPMFGNQAAANENALLRWAVKVGAADLVQYLLSINEVTTRVDIPLRIALGAGADDIVCMLLRVPSAADYVCSQSSLDESFLAFARRCLTWCVKHRKEMTDENKAMLSIFNRHDASRTDPECKKLISRLNLPSVSMFKEGPVARHEMREQTKIQNHSMG